MAEQDFHVATKGTKENEKSIVLVDIDETICFYSDKRRYDLAEPNHDNISRINKLYDDGWEVIYWTARGSVSKKDYYQYTWDQLESWGCKFHNLCTGTGGPQKKPNYDLIIDDKAKRIEEMFWDDLAPEITRQRLIIEGTLHNAFTPEDMVLYSKDISKVLDMTPVGDPVTDHAKEYGHCCWHHWKESGMHIYGWDNRKPCFFSIDLYTCKPFNVNHPINFTKEFFGENLINIVWKE